MHQNVFYEVMAQDIRSITRWEAGLADGMEGLGPDTPAGQRMAETLDFFEFIRAELGGIMERWHERRRTRAP